MALTRAQLLAGNQNLGVVLPGQVQAVSQGLGVFIDTDGTISVDAATAEGLVRLNNSNAYNGYIWPDVIGQPDQFLQLVDASGQLRWADASGFAVVVVDPNAPTPPDEGELWYDCTTGALKVFQNCNAPGGWTNVAQPGKEVTPANTSANPPFTNQGTPNAGTIANPYDCTATTTTPGTSIFIVNEVTVINLAPYQYVPIVDMNAVVNGGRFHFSNNYADATGTLVFETIFIDLPNSASGTNYTANIRVGYASAYIDAVVNVVGPLQLANGGVLSGTPAKGATLTYTRATATGGVPPINYSWQWKNNLGTVLQSGTGAGPQTYVVPAGQVGNTISVELTATDSASPATIVSANSNSLGPITQISIASPGSITGTTAVGGTLTYATGSATGGVSPYTYNWLWKNNSGQTLQTNGSTYNVPSSQVGKTIYVELSANDSATPSSSATAITASTSAVTTLSISNPGTISGTATVGGTLSYTTGTAATGVPPYNYTWEWRNSNNQLLQSGGASYLVTSGEVGLSIFVQLTATDSGTLPNGPVSINAITASTPAVTALTLTSPGSISGTAATGSTLTYTRGSATGGVAPIIYTWQWFNDLGTPLASGSGAGPQSYVIPATEVGRTIYVKLTATDSAASPASVNGDTASTATITGTPITNVQFPTTIPGTANFTWNDGNSVTLTASSCIEFSVNGGGFVTSATVDNTDTITTQWIDSPACGQASQGTTISGTLTSGGLVSTGTIQINRIPTGVTLNPTTRTANVSTVITPVNFSTTGANTSPLIWGTLSAGTTPEYTIDGGSNWLPLPSAPNSSDVIPPGVTAQVRYTTGNMGGTETLLLKAGVSNTVGQFQSATLTTTVSMLPFPISVWDPQPSTGLNSIPGLVSGLYKGTASTITPGGCIEVSKDGSNWVVAPSTLSITPNVDTLYARWISSSSCGDAASDTPITGSVSDGTYENTYNITVQRQPAGFSFTPKSNAPLNTVEVSSQANITGINTTAYITYGTGTTAGILGTLEARIAGGGWTAIPASGTGLPIQNGQSLEVRFNTGTSPSAIQNAVINIGDGDNVKFTQGTYTVTNTASAAIPGLTFAPSATGPTASPANTNLSAPSLYGTVTAIWPTLPTNPTTITSTGSLEFRNVTTAGSFGQTAQIFGTGDVIAVRWNAAAATAALTAGSLTGDLTGSGYVTTQSLTVDKLPAAYDWGDQTGAAKETVVVSSPITISSINCPAELTYTPDPSFPLTDVEASINSGTWTAIPVYDGGITPGLTVNPADVAGTPATTILIRGKTGNANTQDYSITTQIGDGTTSTDKVWTVETTNVPNVIETPSITAPTGTNNNPAAFSPAGLTVTGSSYNITSGSPGVHNNSDWEVFGGLTNGVKNPETGGIVSTSNLTANWTQQTSGVSTTETFFASAYGNNLYLVGGSNDFLLTSPDGVTWTQQSSQFSTTTIQGLAFGNNLYVAVGQGGRLATSTNGTTWVLQTNIGGFGLDFISAASYSAANSLWIIAGALGKMATSPNALGSWTARTSGFGANDIRGVYCGPNLCVAVGDAGTLTTSSNGISWTPQTSSFGASTIYTVYYANNLWVAAGQSGKLATSPDGVNWTQQTLGFGTTTVYGVTYTNGFWIAVGDSGKLATSPDGITWTLQTSSFGAASNIRTIASGNGLAVAAGQSAKIATATVPAASTQLTLANAAGLSFMQPGDTVVEVGGGADATGTITAINTGTPSITVAPSSANWTNGATAKDTSRTISVTAAPLISTNQISGTSAITSNWTERIAFGGIFTVVQGFAYGAGKYVAVGEPAQIATSPDGVTWTAQTNPFGVTIRRAVYGNNTFVAVGNSGKIGTSPDGITWTLRSNGFGTTTLTSAAYGAGLFVVGGGSGLLETSTDGITWTSRNAQVGVNEIRSIIYAGGRFVLVAASGVTSAVSVSNDGITWFAQPNPNFSGTPESIAYNGSVYVVVTSTNKIYSSTDLQTWTQRTSPITGAINLRTVIYAEGIFVTSGGNLDWAASSDGINWTLLVAGYRPAANCDQSLYYANGLWLAGGQNGRLYTATIAAGATTLAIAGADTDGFLPGNTVSNGVTGAGAVSGSIVSLNSTTVTVQPVNATWATGQNLYMGVPLVNVTGDTSNLESYFIPQANLATSSTYYARVKYNSLTTSSQWSAWASFGTASVFLPAIGGAFGGGYYAGKINVGGTIYALVVAPVTGTGTQQGQYGGATPNTVPYKTSDSSDTDPNSQNAVYGELATDQFNDANHPLFQWCKTSFSGNNGPNSAGGIGGYTDWYIPAKNELEVLYYFLKPGSTGTQPNATTSGANFNAVAPEPNGANYTTTNPAQTTASLFQGTNAQAFSTGNPYWSATENFSSITNSWFQEFSFGNQNSGPKTQNNYARAIRRVPI